MRIIFYIIVAMALWPLRNAEALDINHRCVISGEARAYQAGCEFPIIMVEDGPPNTDGRGFSPGNERVLGGLLAQGVFHEVWLNSLGGSVVTGYAIGELLREYGVLVRVPSGSKCVSSCTIAFLGGVLRTFDEGAQFGVHSPSMFNEGLKHFEEVYANSNDAREALLKVSANVHLIDVNGFTDMFAYYQKMIGGQPNYSLLRETYSEQYADRLFTHYINSATFNQDVSRINTLGRTAANDIFMRIERHVTRKNLDVMKELQLSAFGTRADAAYNLMKIMYDCRISDVCYLDKRTLFEYGYVNVR